MVPGDEGELARLADQAPGAIPDFAVLLEEPAVTKRVEKRQRSQPGAGLART